MFQLFCQDEIRNSILIVAGVHGDASSVVVCHELLFRAAVVVVVADSGCYYAVAGKIYQILVLGDYSSLRKEIAIPEIDAISSSRSMIELAREISSPVWYESGSKRMII